MKQITQTIQCKLPGFETVEATFDLMATPSQINEFIRQMGQSGSHQGVVVEVEGWPKEEYGPDPWDSGRAPGVWLAWVSKKGWAQAMREYLDDPNSLTA